MSVIDNGIDNVDVLLKMELPEWEYSEQEPGRGSIHITVAMNLLFTGEMVTMINGFMDMPKGRISETVVDSLVKLFGEGITQGGCYVQD